MNVDVATSIAPDRSVTIDIDVDGKKAVVVIADGEISLSVPTVDGEITSTVPLALAAST